MEQSLAEIADFVGVGTTLAGKYRLERLLGVGGMGAVVCAWHVQLDQAVAVKFLLPARRGSRIASERFFREARASSRIKGPHVARVFDVDVRSDGVPYIVMEYLEGETLATRIAARKRLEIGETVDLAMEICEALAEAHALGIVHRDLKPENVFLSQRAADLVTVKVLDFGISKVQSAERGSELLTSGDTLLGSPPYMSPEQLSEPNDVDYRTDIWSLGVLLYECLSGVRPFRAAGFGPICKEILTAEPPALESIRSETPPELAAMIRRCLRKNARERFDSVEELARQLAPFGSVQSARSLAVIAALAQPPRSPVSVPSESAARGRRTATQTLSPRDEVHSPLPGDSESTGTSLTAAGPDTLAPQQERSRLSRARTHLLAAGLSVAIGVPFVFLTRGTERSVKSPSDVAASAPQRPTAMAQPPTSLGSAVVSHDAAAASVSVESPAPSITALLPKVAPSGSSNEDVRPSRIMRRQAGTRAVPVPSSPPARAAAVSDPVFDERR